MKNVNPHCPFCQHDLVWGKSNWAKCDNCERVLSLREEMKYSDCATFDPIERTVEI